MFDICTCLSGKLLGRHFFSFYFAPKVNVGWCAHIKANIRWRKPIFAFALIYVCFYFQHFVTYSNFRFWFQNCVYIDSTQVSHYFISQTSVNKVYTTLVYWFYITFVDVSHIWSPHSARNFVCMGMLWATIH